MQLKMSEKGSSRKQLIDSYEPQVNSKHEQDSATTLKMFQPEAVEMRTVLMTSLAADVNKEGLERDIRELLGQRQSIIVSIELYRKSALIVCTNRADALECKENLAKDQKGSTSKKVFCSEASLHTGPTHEPMNI